MILMKTANLCLSQNKLKIVIVYQEILIIFANEVCWYANMRAFVYYSKDMMEDCLAYKKRFSLCMQSLRFYKFLLF